jgi:hypothetical protein
VRKLFGLGRSESKKWVDMYTLPDKASMKEFFKLFFNRNYSELETALALLKAFDSVPSKK